jgi:hypothetical protein
MMRHRPEALSVTNVDVDHARALLADGLSLRTLARRLTAHSMAVHRAL